MLNFKNVSLRRGSRVLFANTSFTLHKGQKVGITGANGVGKSSFFALIRNELHPDAGDFTMPQQLEVAHVAQETPATEQAALEYIIDGDQELRNIQQNISQAEQDDNGIKQAELHAKMDIIGGYTATARAARLMNGLGFQSSQERLSVSSFSGGWRMRLNLAQALMCRSDVLLLDEPTNHLDLDAVIFLQDWLCRYPGTLLLISHDREFLDTIADHIVHIENQVGEIYTGNYSAFEKIRAEKLALQQSSFEKQQREIAHIQSFISRFRAQATKAKQAQSRIKSLQRMELIAQAHVDSPFNFSFAQPDKLPNPMLKLENVSIGYGKTNILNDINLFISPGDRIGLLGPNGAGKSTLIKVLANELSINAGESQFADTLKLGYFAQHQLEQLHLDESPLWHLQKINPKATEKELRNFLGGFNFKDDKTFDPIAPFSGGEKARLVLALLVYQNPNLLLLDEPTNHLDLEMRHALSVALQDYQGAIIIVSHDRHMLRSVTDQLYLVANGKVSQFDGDLDDYRLWLNEQKLLASDSAENTPATSINKKVQRKQDAERRKKLKPLYDALRKADKALEKHHQQQKNLESQLAETSLYEESNKVRLKQVLLEKSQIDQALEESELEWMEISEQLEATED
ncbi:MAG: ATP-binding cassette domain-containing protein [Gammaproteobacteria bacterium]|nr:ATP-binding cassette domain-containing protein [Gammaproteobacteria bacterium]MBT5825823.1 ATP-binding cassette domain-containing protein [Gammaproteobacteria bacterium]MBT6418814.1 ATP-binding cassette domain-containing protein [Gammaproteobacteria bacterium]MBT6576655.1 ATP-binding cassette domain-containing protein [Gammaproteobacteria bacterium]MBT7434834.1 ATP-binding cassette domain-containing protein [Gammaproteobacteria bacterium]